MNDLMLPDLPEAVGVHQWLPTFTSEQMREYAQKAVEPLIQAVIQTLEENGHLADGDNCTLLVLKNAVSKYTSLD